MQRIYYNKWLVANPQQQLGTLFLIHTFFLAGFEKYLVRYQDYAQDSLVLCLGSHHTTKKLCALESSDVGNCSVMLVSPTMTRMHLFAANLRNTPWKVREIMTYMSTVWFTYFHTSGSNTMLPNKRNMMLENIGIIFSVKSHDEGSWIKIQLSTLVVIGGIFWVSSTRSNLFVFMIRQELVMMLSLKVVLWHLAPRLHSRDTSRHFHNFLIVWIRKYQNQVVAAHSILILTCHQLISYGTRQMKLLIAPTNTRNYYWNYLAPREEMGFHH